MEPEGDGRRGHGLPAPADPGRLRRYLPPNGREVAEGDAGLVEELAPVGIGAGCVGELEDQGAARDDAGAPGEEVLPHDLLEDAGLAGGLVPEHGDLGQLQSGARPQRPRHILELVHDRDQLLHPCTAPMPIHSASLFFQGTQRKIP